MVVTQREGNRDEVDAEISTSMAGPRGVLLEGPLARGRGSWALSARRSYLELIAGLVGAIGTGGAVPRYSDVQGMADGRRQPRRIGCRCSAWAASTPSTSSLDDREDSEVVSRARGRPSAGSTGAGCGAATGMRRPLSPVPRADYGVHVTEAAGNEARALFDNESREQETVVRSHWRYRPRAGTALAWGVTARRVSGDFDLFARVPTARGLGTAGRAASTFGYWLSGNKSGAFASVEQSLGPRLTATLGGRFDHFTLNRQGAWSPRLGLAYDVDTAHDAHRRGPASTVRRLPAWLARPAPGQSPPRRPARQPLRWPGVRRLADAEHAAERRGVPQGLPRPAVRP